MSVHPFPADRAQATNLIWRQIFAGVRDMAKRHVLRDRYQRGRGMSQKRIIELQKQVKIARQALSLIASANRRQDQCWALASEALDKMWPLDEKQPLQGVVGHERKSANG